jgi:hypothetical protein
MYLQVYFHNIRTYTNKVYSIRAYTNIDRIRSYMYVYERICQYIHTSCAYGLCFVCIWLYLYVLLVYVCIVCICTYLYVLYVFERMYVYVSIVCICMYMYVYVSICMYIFICTYCTYLIVCVCICQRHKYRYMQIRAYTYNTYTYVHTYRICTMCKWTYWIVFLVEYVTHFWNTNKIRTHTNNMVHWWPSGLQPGSTSGILHSAHIGTSPRARSSGTRSARQRYPSGRAGLSSGLVRAGGLGGGQKLADHAERRDVILSCSVSMQTYHLRIWGLVPVRT